MTSNIDGEGNTALGEASLSSALGSANTSIGIGSGTNLLGGSNNTFLGAMAGLVGEDSVETPAINRTAIGYKAAVNQNNTMVLGNGDVTEVSMGNTNGNFKGNFSGNLVMGNGTVVSIDSILVKFATL